MKMILNVKNYQMRRLIRSNIRKKILIKMKILQMKKIKANLIWISKNNLFLRSNGLIKNYFRL